MSIQREENNRPYKPQICQKRGQNRQTFGNRDRNRSFSRDKDKMLDLTTGDNHKTDACNMDMTVGSYRCQNCNNNNRNDSRHRGRQNLGEAAVMTAGIETK